MKELTAKLVLKNLNEKKLETGDYNDILNYVELMLANEEEVVEQLEDRTWRISSKFNAKTVYRREVGFINVETELDDNDEEILVTEKRVHTYIIDGNGTKRVCTWGSTKSFVDVPYNHRSYDEVIKIAEDLRRQAKDVLEANEEYVLSIFKKDDLKEKSKKCYYYEDGYETVYIPKSVVATNEKGQVLIASWFAKKHEEYIADAVETTVPEETTEVKEVTDVAETTEAKEKIAKLEEKYKEEVIELEIEEAGQVNPYDSFDCKRLSDEEIIEKAKENTLDKLDELLEICKKSATLLGRFGRVLGDQANYAINKDEETVEYNLGELYNEYFITVENLARELSVEDYKTYLEINDNTVTRFSLTEKAGIKKANCQRINYTLYKNETKIYESTLFNIINDFNGINEDLSINYYSDMAIWVGVKNPNLVLSDYLDINDLTEEEIDDIFKEKKVVIRYIRNGIPYTEVVENEIEAIVAGINRVLDHAEQPYKIKMEYDYETLYARLKRLKGLVK